MSCFIRSGNVGGSGGDIYEDAACWVAFFFCRGMPGGRGYRSGQGLRRGILLGLRESAKSIAAGSELAVGSDSCPCRNNADSRSPSSYHPSSAAAQTDILSPRLVHPAGRKNIKCAESMVVGCRTGKLLFTGNIPRGVFVSEGHRKPEPYCANLCD